MPCNGGSMKMLGILQHQSFKLLHRIFNVISLILSTICTISYIAFCMPGFVHYQLDINFLQSLIRSIEVLLLPKQLVFRVS
jgi:hypothetical protein